MWYLVRLLQTVLSCWHFNSKNVESCIHFVEELIFSKYVHDGMPHLVSAGFALHVAMMYVGQRENYEGYRCMVSSVPSLYAKWRCGGSLDLTTVWSYWWDNGRSIFCFRVWKLISVILSILTSPKEFKSIVTLWDDKSSLLPLLVLVSVYVFLCSMDDNCFLVTGLTRGVVWWSDRKPWMRLCCSMSVAFL